MEIEKAEKTQKLIRTTLKATSVARLGGGSNYTVPACSYAEVVAQNTATAVRYMYVAGLGIKVQGNDILSPVRVSAGTVLKGQDSNVSYIVTFFNHVHEVIEV